VSLIIRLASQQLEPVPGLHRLTNWVRERGLHRAAVTNAPRPNAEQMIAALGLTDFFKFLVIGSECERAKPFPDPYLKALEHFGVSPQHAFAIEVCTSCL
jgi:HAD superfamily hydrolase (TIGR01509 family)